jgi:hypothetical protein
VRVIEWMRGYVGQWVSERVTKCVSGLHHNHTYLLKLCLLLLFLHLLHHCSPLSPLSLSRGGHRHGRTKLIIRAIAITLRIGSLSLHLLTGSGANSEALHFSNIVHFIICLVSAAHIALPHHTAPSQTGRIYHPDPLPPVSVTSRPTPVWVHS